MRIHTDPRMQPNRVRIEDKGVAAVEGPLHALRWDDTGEDDDVDIYVHPEDAEWLIATFFPNFKFIKRSVH